MRFLASLCIAAISITSAWGTEYYISSSTGSDQCNGLSPEQPWKTLNKINNTSLNLGDRILLKRGDVWREGPGLTIAGSGSESSLIEVTAYGVGPKPVLNGSVVLSGWSSDSKGNFQINYRGISTGLLEDGKPIRKASSSELLDGGWYYDGTTIYYRPSHGSASDHLVESCRRTVIQIYPASYISINDIEIYGGAGSGIWVVNSTHLQIKNCTVKANAGAGIGIANDPIKPGDPCSDISIEGNTISWNANGIYLISENGAKGLQKIKVMRNLVEYNDFNAVWGHATKDGHGLGIQNTSGSYFGENEFRYNRTGPALWTARDRRSDNNVFARNFVHHNQKFGMNQGGEGQDNSEGNLWTFNIISDNGTDDGLDGGFRINRRQSRNNQFVNNTLARNDVNWYLYSMTDFAVIKNNISYLPKWYHVLIEGSLNGNTFMGNLYYPDAIGLFGVGTNRGLDFVQWSKKTGQDKDSFVGDPLFSNLSLLRPEDYIPLPNSPAYRTNEPWEEAIPPKGLIFAADSSPVSPTTSIQVLSNEAVALDYFGKPMGSTRFIGAIKNRAE